MIDAPLPQPDFGNLFRRLARRTAGILAMATVLTSLHAATPAGKTQQLAPGQTPEGLQKSDWQNIRAAHSAWQHGFMPIAGGWQARNPGQQWNTKFDARGFLTAPKDGAWSWGLELQSYGVGEAQTAIGGLAPAMQAEGQRLTYQWDPTLQEWWVNDARGLEHGYTVTQRPASPGHPPSANHELTLVLATRGTLTPKVDEDRLGVRFADGAGATVLTYAGLKVWDAEGKVLPSRFEAAGEKVVRLRVQDAGARYPLTIDPIAQQAYVKPSADSLGYAGVGDRFGTAVAVAGDTVVVGAPQEDSGTTGINSTPDEGASAAGAAYVFVRSGTAWSQQAYLKPAAVGTTQAGDQFGISVAVAGDTVVVGATVEDSGTTGINSTPNETASDAGAIYIFDLNGQPNIAVAQAGALTDGAGSVDFGPVATGSSSTAKTFTITNPGTADLTGLAVTKDGANPGDFTVSALSATSIPVGNGTVTFTVTFTPGASGARSAAIHLASNVTGAKNPFDIALTGTGLVVNAAPVAGADGLNRPNTTTVAKVLKSVLLGNDSDADSDPLTLTAVGNALPAGATVTLAGNFVVYTAPAANAGNGSFTYTLSAGAHSVTGTVTVTETTTSGGGGGTPNYLTLVQSGNDFVVTFLGVPGGSFRVQYTTSTAPPYVWNEFTPQAIYTAAPNGVFTHTDVNPPGPVRFYRAVSNP